MEQVERPAPAGSVQVQDEPVAATVQTAGAQPGRERRDEEQLPGRRDREPDEADAMQRRGKREDGPTPEALRDQPAAQGAGRVHDGVHEIEDADPRVRLVERVLDGPDQRWDQQPAPTDEQE